MRERGMPLRFEVTEVIANGMTLVLGIALAVAFCAKFAGPGSFSSSQTLKRSASATRRGSALIQREGEKKMATLPKERLMEIPEPLPQELPKDLQDMLLAPLPAEAIKDNDRTPHLSAIIPAFVIERMNQVFGVGGYHTTYKVLSHEKVMRTFKKGQQGQYDKEQFVGTVQGFLDIPKYGIHLENFGGSENDDLGDALKGAATDAFTKNCSILGIGLDVYKGKYDKPKQSEFPPCPKCGKELRKSKDSEELYCWTKKNGCGWRGTLEGLKAVEAHKNAPAKPAQSTQQPRQQAAQPTPSDPSKITITGVVSKREMVDGKLWLQVGDYKCVTMQGELQVRLQKAFVGATVELMVSPLSGSNGTTIHQIHKVIDVKKPGGGQ